MERKTRGVTRVYTQRRRCTTQWLAGGGCAWPYLDPTACTQACPQARLQPFVGRTNAGRESSRKLQIAIVAHDSSVGRVSRARTPDSLAGIVQGLPTSAAGSVPGRCRSQPGGSSAARLAAAAAAAAAGAGRLRVLAVLPTHFNCVLRLTCIQFLLFYLYGYTCSQHLGWHLNS